MAMTTVPRDKTTTTNVFWWQLPERPICPTCKILCPVYSSRISALNVRVQYRKCPKCGYQIKSQIPAAH